MIILDTCVLVFDALAPEQLSKRARAELEDGRLAKSLACSDISLWEIAMLLCKERIRTKVLPRDFLHDVVMANRLQVLPITPEIAALAVAHPAFVHGDPADRIIGATALHHQAALLTCDQRLRALKGLRTVW